MKGETNGNHKRKGRPLRPGDPCEKIQQPASIRIPHRIVGRRPGDVAAAYADPAKAMTVLGWRSVRGVDAMCRDAWNWQRANPRGYEDPDQPGADAPSFDRTFASSKYDVASIT